VPKTASKEFLTMPFTLSLPFKFSAGPYLGRFFTELRDHAKLWANRCPRCQRVMLPPRVVCGACHAPAGEWVEVADKGKLITYTVVVFPMSDPMTGKVKPVPYGFGGIQLEGADSILGHFLEETNLNKLRIGLRMRAVFKPREERLGDLTDILFFRTIEE